MCGDRICVEAINKDAWGNYPINPSDYPEIFEHFYNYTCATLIPGFNRIFIRASLTCSAMEEVICTSCYILLPQTKRATYKMQRHFHKTAAGNPADECFICNKKMLLITPAASCQKCIITFLNHEVELEQSSGIHHGPPQFKNCKNESYQ